MPLGRNIAYLDGQVFDDAAINGLEQYKMTITLDDKSKTVIVRQTNELTFIGDAFKYLEQKFYQNNCPPDSVEVQLLIDPKCCGVKDLYFIQFSDIENYCPSDSEITLVARSKTDETEALRCMENNLIWYGQNGKNDPYFQDPNNIIHPQIPYCSTPATNFVVDILILILQTIDNIAPFINLQDSINALRGCGHSHPAPFIRSYLENICRNCGLTLSSTIFQQGTHRKTAFFAAQHEEGTTSGENWIPDNAPNLNGVQFLDLLKPVYSLDYRIDGTTLKVEREDTFFNNAQLLVNVDTAFAEGLAETAPCYVWDEQQKYSYGRFEYTNDAIDEQGNKEANTYNDIVEWNPNGAVGRKGEYSNIVAFSPSRFKDEESAILQGSGELIGALVLKSTTASQYKLINLEKDSYAVNESALAVSEDLGNGTYRVNSPMFFDAELPTPELYQNFHSYKDPSEDTQCLKITDFIFIATCEQILLAREKGVDVRNQSERGAGAPIEIEIDYGQTLITIKDTELK